MSPEKKATKILARTFFNQLRTGGYSSNQILEVATELIELVTADIRETPQIIPDQDAASVQLRKTA